MFGQKKMNDFHSHWNTLIPNFSYSSKNFYNLLEKELLSHNIPEINISKVNLHQGGITSSRRTYLRVKWKEYQYDMCCAPFADGLFLSWWLTYETSDLEKMLSRIPFIGNWLIRIFHPTTYYRIDSASMLMTYCHQSVLTVADAITKETGIRISEQERKPILKDIFKR